MSDDQEQKHGPITQAAVNTACAIKDGAVAIGSAIADTKVAQAIKEGAVNTGHAIADSVRAAGSSTSEKAGDAQEYLAEKAHEGITKVSGVPEHQDSLSDKVVAAKDYVAEKLTGAEH